MAKKGKLSLDSAGCSDLGHPILNALTRVAYCRGLSFIPASLKEDLARRGLWPDIMQSVYMSVVELFKNRPNLSLDKDGRIGKADYRALLRKVGKDLFRTVRELVPGYKRGVRFYNKECSWMVDNRTPGALETFGWDVGGKSPDNRRVSAVLCRKGVPRTALRLGDYILSVRRDPSQGLVARVVRNAYSMTYREYLEIPFERD